MSEITQQDATVVTIIPPCGPLDRITVFWQDFGHNRGAATITCWGSAWTVYFGAMPEPTIREFFVKAYTSYLVNKLGITQWLKQSKKHDNYLARIVEAIKTDLADRKEKESNG